MSAFLYQFWYNEFGDNMNPFTMKLRRKNNYFEGYYVRVIDQSKSFNKAFIFGITTNKKDKHAFMQLVDGDNLKTVYYRFGIDEFSYDKNSISMPGITLTNRSIDITTKDFSIKGEFSRIVGISKKFGSNSAMSFLHMFPMKTYQEIVIMDAVFKGEYKDSKSETILEGRTYMEKTYGHFFPKTWAWIQSNQFDKDVKLSCSIGDAKIAGFKLKGYVISLIHDSKEYRFATYLRDKLKIVQEPDIVHVTVKNRKYSLEIIAKQKDPITLKGPGLYANMNRDVYESISSTIDITLRDKSGIIVQSSGTHVGMENMYED